MIIFILLFTFKDFETPLTDKIVLSSEMGVLPHPEEKIKEKWRLQPGKMLLIDLDKGAIKVVMTAL